MQLNRRGFTLVELLAVVVILGIIMTVSIPAVSKWINRSKGESKEAQKQTLLLAGQAYAQGNSKVLPKAIGETKLIKAIDLRKANYLKEDLVDSDKKDCMKDSVVRIYKYDRNGYSYTAYLYCEGDDVPNSITGIKPVIGITFTGENLKDGAIQDVSKAGFRVTIEGGKKDGKNLGIDGYTYSISVKYAGTGEVVEIFNSGSLNAGGKEKLVIEKSLGDYTKITTLSEFMVTVEAYNRDGGYNKQSANSKYGDKTPPVCGDVTGQAGANQWYTTPHTSTISVKCIDEANGSGCTKDVFTKSWNTEIEDDTITIRDNAGNTTKCKVRVHHDWTRPTLTVTAFVRNSDGSKGAQVGSVTANNANNTVTISDYTNSYGDNHWLNLANYPNGIYFEVSAVDNIHVTTGEWHHNEKGISNFNASNVNTLSLSSSYDFSPTNQTTHTFLSSEGIRRGKYVLSDKANHKVTVNIEANIDRTNPGCTSSGGSSSWKNTDITIKGTCSDGISGCKDATITKTYKEEINSSKEGPGTVYDNANNSTKCPTNQTVMLDKTPPSCSTTKGVINTTLGVTVSLGCWDNLSGIASCPCRVRSKKSVKCIASTELKESKYYTVSDQAGNSSGCSVTVTKYDAYNMRTRSANTCTAACCGTYSCNCRQVYDDCAYEWWDDDGRHCDPDYVTKCSTCNYQCTNASCCGYSAWGAWSGYKEQSCSPSATTQCVGPRDQYK